MLRRRNVGRAAAGAVVLLAALGTAPALALAPPGRVVLDGDRAAFAPDLGRPGLTAEDDTLIAQAQQDGRLGEQVNLSTVIDDPTWVRDPSLPWYSGGSLRWSSGCGRSDNGVAALAAKKRVAAWCWPAVEQEAGHVGAADWVPQGITTTRESSSAGTYGGRSILAVSWYGGARGRARGLGSRVSLAALPRVGFDARFTHVALVERSVTDDGALEFLPVRVHAGGIAWSGHYLYVPDTHVGVRVFDVRRTYRVANGPVIGSGADGILNGGGARYAMVEVGRYVQGYGALRCRDSRRLPMCFSTVSIDRSTSPPRLTVAEYLTRAQMRHLGRGASITWWSLGSDGLVLPQRDGDLWSLPVRSSSTYATQGLVTLSSVRQYYFSAGDIGDGWFVWQRLGDGRKAHVTPTWPAGAEALTRDPRTGRLWSLTEKPGRRVLFWVNGCEMRGAKRGCAH